MSEVVAFSNTPTGAVIAVCVLISIIAAATWKNAKGEGWGLVIFLASLIVGFNLSAEFAVWILEWMGRTFDSLGSMIGGANDVDEGFGILGVLVVLGISVWIFRTIKFDTIRLASLGTLYGILLRLMLDFVYFLIQSGIGG